MLEGAGAGFDARRVLEGKTTPVFFGSAMNNFGVQLLLDNFLKYSSPPTARRGRDGDGPVNPADEKFSGFVFKIQANMDPRHRDRIAFVRVVSGRFERDMFVLHAQSGKRIRLGSAQKLFGQERHTIDEAFAGDVIGLIGNDMLGIGDTLTEDRSVLFDEIPRFAPEVFAFLHNPSTANSKKFRLGLDQLLKEGVVQVLEREGAASGSSKVPLLAAVGPLQFEVVQYRLQSEYGAESRLEPAPWTVARWPEDPAASFSLPDGSARATDRYGMLVLLFPDQWAVAYFQKNNPAVKLLSEPPSIRQSAAIAG
jgi:peptide chain release factor 3